MPGGQNQRLSLRGIFPPIATPFNDDESIAFDKLELNFKKWNQYPFGGYVIEGSTGEYVYLSSAEKINLIKRAKEFVGNDKILIAGSGCESTRETVYMTRKMAEAGADAVMVVTPSYFKADMKNESMIRHFEEVAKQSPIPVILYNVPGYTNVELSVDAIEHLSRHDNIIGIKESGDSIIKITSILHRTSGQDFQVMVGFAGLLLPSLYMGCCGGVSSLANILGKEVCELYRLHTEGDKAKEEAVTLQRSLISPEIAVTRKFGIAGLKEIMDLKGFYGGPARSPLQKLSEEESQELISIFKSAGYL